MSITENYQKIRETIPEHVTIVVAAKQRNPNEIIEVIKAGATDIGENYVQEGEKIYNTLFKEREKVRWHMIGHLQTNKINKALKIFDIIQTIDSLKMAQAIDKRVEHTEKKVIPVYIEINIGSEISKSGIKPDYKIMKCFHTIAFDLRVSPIKKNGISPTRFKFYKHAMLRFLAAAVSSGRQTQAFVGADFSFSGSF